jgi:hypothetical protein
LAAHTGHWGSLFRARETLQRTLDIKQALYGEHHIQLAAALANLGIVYGELGEHHKETAAGARSGH